MIWQLTLFNVYDKMKLKKAEASDLRPLKMNKKEKENGKEIIKV